MAVPSVTIMQRRRVFDGALSFSEDPLEVFGSEKALHPTNIAEVVLDSDFSTIKCMKVHSIGLVVFVMNTLIIV
jgi:hypothetical protein